MSYKVSVKVGAKVYDVPFRSDGKTVLVVGLDALFDKPWFRTGETTPSGHVGLVMGACLLGFAIFAAVGHVGVTGG